MSAVRLELAKEDATAPYSESLESCRMTRSTFVQVGMSLEEQQ
jgi:hypothetical protein